MKNQFFINPATFILSKLEGNEAKDQHKNKTQPTSSFSAIQKKSLLLLQSSKYAYSSIKKSLSFIFYYLGTSIQEEAHTNRNKK